MTNKHHSLQQLMRWYGPRDPVSLRDIAHAGCEGVVTALHHIPVGEVWTQTSILRHKKMIEAAGLTWEVVESLPVHEDIKTRSGNYAQLIEQYIQSMQNLAGAGIKVITYNFMPVLDWLRTDLHFILKNGAEALKFSFRDYAIFDLFLLKRPGAEEDYPAVKVQELRGYFSAMPPERREILFKNMLQGLPGSDVPFTREEILQLLDNYRHIDATLLKKHLVKFLKAIVPKAEECGIKMAIHPDDPPFSVLGLPRIMSTSRDIKDIMTAVGSPANGLCFCTGSLGARADNDLVAMAKEWGSRIHFLHLRNTTRDPGTGDFYEANHLEGDTDLYTVVKEVIQLMIREDRRIPMRPDHGHRISSDLSKEFYPGYSLIGRLKGLAELRGLEMGIYRSLKQ